MTGPASAPEPRRRAARRRQGGALRQAAAFLNDRRAALGLALSLGIVGAAGAYGAVRGGHYEAFVAGHGDPRDLVARSIGFDIEAVTISGQNDLTEAEVLEIAGIGPKTSLAFLDAADVRKRLMRSPFVKDASVRKLYPSRVVITLVEREAFGLWQKDGKVNVIARDGVVIDEMRDGRFAGRPFVVGEGANARIDEYLALLEAAGDMREKIRAGMLVAGRRWNLKTTGGIDIKLPELNPRAALQALARLDRETRILDKDAIALDMREPGRIIARLSEEGMAARADAAARKSGKAKGNQT